VASENDLDVNSVGTLIGFKYLFPTELINKPNELYNIIQQYGAHCSVVSKSIETRTEDFTKQLIDNLEDNTNANIKKQILKKLRPVPGFFIMQTARFAVKQFQNDPHERVAILGNENDYKTNQNRYGISSLQENIEEIIGQNDRIKFNPTQKDLQTVENAEKRYLEYKKIEFLDAMPRTPFFTFEHTLFIYPLSVSFEKCKPLENPKLKPVNILLEITLKENQDVVGAPRIHHYDRLIHRQMCAVTFEDNAPVFHEELRVQLPLPIKPAQHLLFNFYHLNADKNISKRRKGLETIPRNGLSSYEEDFADTVQKISIGHAILPLTSCTEPQDNIHSLIIFKKLSTSYFDQHFSVSIGDESRDDSPLPFFDTKRNLFKIRTRLMSTIYPKEPALSRFFTDCSPFLNVTQRTKTHNMKFINNALSAAMEAISELTKVSFMRLISHYTLVLDMLFSIICRTQDVLHNFVNAHSQEGGEESEEQMMAMIGAKFSDISSNAPKLSIAESIRSSKHRKSMALTNEPARPTTPTVALVEPKRNSRGSIMLDKRKSKDLGLSSLSQPVATRNGSPTTATTPTFSAKVKSRISLKLGKALMTSTAEEERLSPVSGSARVPQPGDADFVLLDYLKNRSESPKDVEPAPSPVIEEKKRSKRFSIFGGPKRNSIKEITPVLATTPVLKQLAKKPLIQQDEEADNMTDFLTVSSNIFELQKVLFQALIAMLKGAGFSEDTSDPSNKLLTSYVQYVFKDVLTTTSPLCFVLCELWTDMLSKADENLNIVLNTEGMEEMSTETHVYGANALHGSSTPRNRTKSVRVSNKEQTEMSKLAKTDSYRNMTSSSTPVYVESLRFAWFFFDVIVKSFTIHMEPVVVREEDTEVEPDKVDRSKSGYKLASLLKELVKTLADKIREYKDDFANSTLSKHVNQQLAFFFRDLFNCGHIQSKFVFDIMESYFTELCKNNFTGNTIKLKAEFMQIFVDYPYYIALHNNQYHMKDYIREAHISPPVKLMVIMIKEAMYGYRDETDIHKSCIDAITYALTKHDYDARFGKAERKKVARIYFPLVSMIVQHHHSFMSLHDKERRDYLRCILWILGNIDKEFLALWVMNKGNDVTIRYISVLKLVTLATHTFGAKVDEKKGRAVDANVMQILQDLLITMVSCN
jgi:hypothetical protein